MDLRFFDTITRSKAGVIVKLRDPRTGNDTNAWFRILGPDSDVYREAERKVFRMRKERMANSDDDLGTFTDQEKIELVAPCVVYFGDLEENGDELQFSQAEVRRVLAKYPVILRQLDNKIGDARHFLEDVSGNSQASGSIASG